MDAEAIAKVEGKAERMGWVPQDDFKGDPEKWVSAERFVERGENELPIMRERMRKLDTTVVGLNTKIATMTDTFGEFQKHQKGVADRAYAKGMKDITAKQRAAVTDGDEVAFDEAEKEKEALVKELPPDVKVKVGDAEVAAQAELDTWVADGNEWYNNDPELKEYASYISTFVQGKTKLKGIKLYDAVKKEVKARYPDKFKNPKQDEPPLVMGGGEPPVPKGKRTFANLPKEAQEAANRFIKDIPGYTKEKYVKEYEWE